MQAAEFIQRFYQLTPKPKAVLIAFLEGAEDEAIAIQLKLSTATVRKHIQNLCDHFSIATEGELGKQNRRQTLFDLGQAILREWLVEKNPEVLQKSAIVEPSSNVENPPQQNLAHLPQVGQLWGRQTEHDQLTQWLTNPDLRLGIISGLPGCGKTSLVAQEIATVADQFDYIYWRSLLLSISFLQCLDECLNQAEKRPISLIESLENQLEPLLNLLRQKRCLLVFDDWQTLFASQQFAGHYQGIYQGYQTFLHQIIQTSHQSLILIITQTLPADVNRWLRPGMPVKNLKLGGLGEYAPLMLQQLGLTGEAAWPKLIETCGDRPLSLLFSQTVIQSLFASNVESYLDFNPLGITEDHFALVKQSLTPLTPVEYQILTVIALAESPLSLIDLAPQIPLNQLGLLSALNSLANRHLLQTIDHSFILEAAIANGLLSLFVQKIWQELVQLVQENILTKQSYWVNYNLQAALSDPKSHPNFHQLWRSYQQENPQLISVISSEYPISLSPETGYFITNWQALVASALKEK